MPIPIAEAVAEQADLARTKAVAAKNVPKFLFSSALAGAFVGVGIVLLAATTGPLAAANSPAVKLVAGAVFGVALTLVVMAGSELFTGLNMVMLQGLAAGTVNALEVLFVWISSLVGNLIGALAFSWLINAGGTLSAKTPAGKLGPGEAFIESLVKAKNAAPGAQLFWRALACNMLVCLAVWMAARTRNDAAKVMLIWWCLMAFIAVGLEHGAGQHRRRRPRDRPRLRLDRRQGPGARGRGRRTDACRPERDGGGAGCRSLIPPSAEQRGKRPDFGRASFPCRNRPPRRSSERDRVLRLET